MRLSIFHELATFVKLSRDNLFMQFLTAAVLINLNDNYRRQASRSGIY